MYLHMLVQRGRVPLRKQGDESVELPIPADFGVAHRSTPRLHVGLIRIIFGTGH